MPVSQIITPGLVPEVHHVALDTTFRGVEHPLSASDAPIHQYRGIKYASVPARFRPSKLFSSYPPLVDATKYGPICPQVKNMKNFEETLFGLAEDDFPTEVFKHNEFECLNLNITCPAGLNSHSHIPVMVWVHGGGDRGCGSSWVYDGGALVRKSVLLGKPVILVSFNFRLGLFGFAAGPQLREDNRSVGEDGVGNYGLRDQRKLLEWLHHYIGDFGGDPHNITLFGESTGAADIIYHLLSAENETRPLFHRAIVQSAVIDYNLPDVAGAGWQLSRLMSTLHLTTIDQLRLLDADQLVKFGQTLRVVDDGVFLRHGWKDSFVPENAHRHHHNSEHHLSVPKSGGGVRSSHSRSRVRPSPSPSGSSVSIRLPSHLQPLIIGDCASDSLLWSTPISYWTSAGVTRRLKAVCTSLSKAAGLLRAYDISSSTPDSEIGEHVLELVNDARVAWPTECFANSARALRGGKGVWRYVFDQEGPIRPIPHHAVDLMYLFDNVALPDTSSTRSDEPSSSTMSLAGSSPDDMWPESFCAFDDDDSEEVKYSSSVRGHIGDEEMTFDDYEGPDFSSTWAIPMVDEHSYARVRDTLQERWLAFAHAEAPWNEDKVFVFGPEGETGERTKWIFDGRRRRKVWKETLEPLGMQLVQKIGVELSRGPPLK
ncbi:alpha/beta-hydrolase [Dendrothele bispora CBS 962.96]|uniref:Carboxylic ester hydrolase n=1 Tax=Dendrothele bispora (strain CBS 962.96) TaxID=1314807 RepID=A0A4S8LJ83_DENBC|nr:alpha/beta-hydrolase [Dendrothele bispora CBS 962.96]